MKQKPQVVPVILPDGQPAKRPPLPGTSEEAWEFLGLLRDARASLGLCTMTLGYASAKLVTVILVENHFEREQWVRIAQNLAKTESSHGVVPRQILASKNAAVLFEGLIDAPWGEGPTATFKPTVLP